jgi:hypothetical protein
MTVALPLERALAAAECREEQRGILHRVKLDERERILQVREALLGRYVSAAETHAAPLGERV